MRDCTKLAAANTFALFQEHFSLSCYLWKQQLFSQLLPVKTTVFFSAVNCGNNSFSLSVETTAFLSAVTCGNNSFFFFLQLFPSLVQSLPIEIHSIAAFYRSGWSVPGIRFCFVLLNPNMPPICSNAPSILLYI